MTLILVAMSFFASVPVSAAQEYEEAKAWRDEAANRLSPNELAQTQDEAERRRGEIDKNIKARQQNNPNNQNTKTT